MPPLALKTILRGVLALCVVASGASCMAKRINGHKVPSPRINDPHDVQAFDIWFKANHNNADYCHSPLYGKEYDAYRNTLPARYHGEDPSDPSIHCGWGVQGNGWGVDVGKPFLAGLAFANTTYIIVNMSHHSLLNCGPSRNDRRDQYWMIRKSDGFVFGIHKYVDSGEAPTDIYPSADTVYIKNQKLGSEHDKGRIFAYPCPPPGRFTTPRP